MVFEEYEKPVAAWQEKELYNNEQLNCLTIILRTGGCSWQQCLMCGYKYERFPPHSLGELENKILSQLEWIKKRFRTFDYSIVKIFTSGSFFNSLEIPSQTRIEIGKTFKGKLVIVETRPEFVNRTILNEFISEIDDGSWSTPLYVAMGLETTSDYIRNKSINKGFSYSDFVTAVNEVHKSRAGVKIYLLMKPPFLTEREAINDMITSIEESTQWSENISMNVCTVQGGTMLEKYWRQRAYRPPYLWSVLYVLRSVKTHVICDPVGGGFSRGPHNCGKCDFDIVRGIREYSLTTDKALLDTLLESDCYCKREWQWVIENEMPYGMPLTR